MASLADRKDGYVPYTTVMDGFRFAWVRYTKTLSVSIDFASVFKYYLRYFALLVPMS